MEVWIGGRTPREYDRAGRLAQGWLGSFQTPAEAGEARRLIERACERHGREIDDDHFGMVLPYARTIIGPALEQFLERARPGVAPSDLVPTGADALKSIVDRYVAEGITKFVLIPAAPPASWDEELGWLSPVVREIEA
jgi:alkanesulfonate monooxygenase SsuD/methylene tetrahydromethanopterin reductase-like flavin-dependent oxidoreductase (luciferase family)